MNKHLLVALLAGGALLTAAGCGSGGASEPGRHTANHTTTSHLVTGRAHTTGSGAPDRWSLTLRGARQPVSVPKTTYRRCQIGERYPACAAD